jgi:23S rRNA (guanosine2251-2'-O)-methyltransferase
MNNNRERDSRFNKGGFKKHQGGGDRGFSGGSRSGSYAKKDSFGSSDKKWDGEKSSSFSEGNGDRAKPRFERSSDSKTWGEKKSYGGTSWKSKGDGEQSRFSNRDSGRESRFERSSDSNWSGRSNEDRGSSFAGRSRSGYSKPEGERYGFKGGSRFGDSGPKTWGEKKSYVSSDRSDSRGGYERKSFSERSEGGDRKYGEKSDRAKSGFGGNSWKPENKWNDRDKTSSFGGERKFGNRDGFKDRSAGSFSESYSERNKERNLSNEAEDSNAEKLSTFKRDKKDTSSSHKSGVSFVYGKHATLAAINNPKRVVYKVFVENADEFTLPKNISPVLVTKERLQVLCKDGDKHQGIAAEISELLCHKTLKDYMEELKDKAKVTIVLLDQINDPHNLGAILRSACCFGVDLVVTTKFNMPPINGSVIRSSAGMSEMVNILTISNLNQAIDELKSNGFMVCGMDAGVDSIELKSAIRISTAGEVFKEISSNLAAGIEGGEEKKAINIAIDKVKDLMENPEISELLKTLDFSKKMQEFLSSKSDLDSKAVANGLIDLVNLAGKSVGDIKSSNQRKLSVIMGNEGKGLRQSVRENCDKIARIPMNPIAESLNVSTAAAVCMYEIFSS